MIVQVAEYDPVGLPVTRCGWGRFSTPMLTMVTFGLASTAASHVLRWTGCEKSRAGGGVCLFMVLVKDSVDAPLSNAACLLNFLRCAFSSLAASSSESSPSNLQQFAIETDVLPPLFPPS